MDNMDDRGDHANRRKFLKVVGALGATGAAGCLGSDGGGPTDTQTSDTTDTPVDTTASATSTTVDTTTPTPNPRDDSQPNVLLITSDDHTAQAVSVFANDDSLPTVGSHLGDVVEASGTNSNITRLAEEGARLNNCFATNSLCAPSRASILTGQYSHGHGVRYNTDQFDPSQPTVANEIGNLGYETAMIGKWHLGTDPEGFDHWERLLGQGAYFSPTLKSESGSTQHDGFSSDVIADRSINWLQNREDSEEPFFMVTQFKACHEDFRYPDRFADLFEGEDIPEPETLFEDLSHRSPASRGDPDVILDVGNENSNTIDEDARFGPTIESMGRSLIRQHGVWDSDVPEEEQHGDEFRREAYQAFIKMYLRSAAAIDDNIGRLLDHLEEEGILDDTIVIYTSDQGYFLGEHHYVDKRWMFEEGIRMPTVVRYPPEIDPGTVIDDITLNVDFAPTILDYAGLREMNLATPAYMDGESLRPFLRGANPEDWRDSMYYRYWGQDSEGIPVPWGGVRPAHYGIRTDRYKLIFYYGLNLGVTGFQSTEPGAELYDLKEDPKETNNVYGDPEYEDVESDLKGRLLDKKEALSDEDTDPELLERRQEVLGV